MTDRPLANLSSAELDQRIERNRASQREIKPTNQAAKRTLALLRAECAELIAERNRREDMQELPL